MSRLSQRIENFRNAFDILKDSVSAYNKDKKNKVNHMALIKSFEVCFELGWKILKDYLESNKIFPKFPREVIKEAFLFGLLPNAQIWINMLDSRNLSSHEYNMDKINKILENINNFYFDEFKNLYSLMEKING